MKYKDTHFEGKYCSIMKYVIWEIYYIFFGAKTHSVIM